MLPKIIILGCTGQLGTKLLNYTKKNNIKIFASTCYKNKTKLLSQKSKFKIEHSFVLSNSLDRKKFLKILQNKIDIIYFLDFGSQSLLYLNELIKFNSKTFIAIANKEMIIAGGKILFKKIKSSKNIFIPLDSEHFSLKNSIFKDIKKILITASGGPFFFSNKKSFSKVSFREVMAHPKWKMGINNSIDSSNFINKLLEIYELSYIYDVPTNKIDFLVSKEAFIHSILIYQDGTISLNGFKNDMLITLIYPLNFFFNIKNKITSENLLLNKLNFRLDSNYDHRFNFFNFYNKMRKLNHSEQIKLMLLNNKAQSLYLSKKIKYIDIIPFIMKKIDIYPNLRSSNSLISIVNYIVSLKNKINE